MTVARAAVPERADPVRLSSSIAGEGMRERPPVRLLHIGLGAFHRSHQLWHTAVSDPEHRWGYASFTGRRAEAARALSEQDGLYNVLIRSSSEDRTETISHLVEPHDGADVARFAALAADPAVAVITLTITEPGYHLDSAGRLDLADPLIDADIAALRAIDRGALPTLATALGRLVFGLDARRRAGTGALTVLPCDNMPDNGAVVRQAVLDLASGVSNDLREWISSEIRFASSVVDRITPATTEGDIDDYAARTGTLDEGLVVTEPFSEWIISGDFPAGRPEWERSGARIVGNVAPFERRKLWLLNGAHTVLATTARSRGYATVGDAIADPTVRGWVEEFWDAAQRWLPEPELAIDGYRLSLLQRFANTRIVHHLDQIAVETSTKLRFRIVPVLLSERAERRMPVGCVRPLAGWIRGIHAGMIDQDADRTRIDEALADSPCIGDRASVARLLGLLNPALADDEDLVTSVTAEASRVSESTPEPHSERNTP